MKRRRRRDILRVQLVRIFELLADAGVISHRLVLNLDISNFRVITEYNLFAQEMHKNKNVCNREKKTVLLQIQFASQRDLRTNQWSKMD